MFDLFVCLNLCVSCVMLMCIGLCQVLIVDFDKGKFVKEVRILVIFYCLLGD